jgi:hypothetical protein
MITLRKYTRDDVDRYVELARDGVFYDVHRFAKLRR